MATYKTNFLKPILCNLLYLIFLNSSIFSQINSVNSDMFLFCFTSFLHDLQTYQHHTGFFQISFVFPHVLCYTIYVRNLSAAD